MSYRTIKATDPRPRLEVSTTQPDDRGPNGDDAASSRRVGRPEPAVFRVESGPLPWMRVLEPRKQGGNGIP